MSRVVIQLVIYNFRDIDRTFKDNFAERERERGLNQLYFYHSTYIINFSHARFFSFQSYFRQIAIFNILFLKDYKNSFSTFRTSAVGKGTRYKNASTYIVISGESRQLKNKKKAVISDEG